MNGVIITNMFNKNLAGLRKRRRRVVPDQITYSGMLKDFDVLVCNSSYKELLALKDRLEHEIKLSEICQKEGFEQS